MSETGISTVFCSWDFSNLYFSDPKLFAYRDSLGAAAFVFSRTDDTLRGLHYGGVVTNCPDQAFCADVVAQLTEYFQTEGVRSYQMRNHPFLSTIKVGTLIKEEPFVFIDLTRPSKELDAALSKQHRRCIRKADESGLKVVYSDDGRKYLNIFYDYYQARQEQMDVQPHAYAFFEQMFKSLRDHLIIGVVRQADQIFAVSLLLQDLDHVFMTYGGMSDEGYERYAKHLMVSDMMLRFKSIGFTKLVLGTGNNGKDSIFDFKRGFVNREHSVLTYGV
ncbi:MAG: GNAT family N-acetyltransferase [Candidatus Omnitrophica bacterium]|nr:GNAT family N-acetyltransferase [Candidatus Omnitrophota bacterium]